MEEIIKNFLKVVKDFIRKNPEAKDDMLWLIAFHNTDREILNAVKEMAGDNQEICRLVDDKIANSEKYY